MSELNWDWEVIATAMLWRLARKGVVITRKDLGSLPFDRVLVDHRDPEGTYIKLSFVPVDEAEKIRDATPVIPGQRVTVSEMQGRWQKLAIVALWKLRKTLPVVLTKEDRARVPHDRLLLIEGFKDDVLLHFVGRHQARKMLDDEQTKLERIK
jgi:hypothetical protein